MQRSALGGIKIVNEKKTTLLYFTFFTSLHEQENLLPNPRMKRKKE